MSHKFTRFELYQLVWSEPLRKLAKRFGIADVAIGKRCRRSMKGVTADEVTTDVKQSPAAAYQQREPVFFAPVSRQYEAASVVTRSPPSETCEASSRASRPGWIGR